MWPEQDSEDAPIRARGGAAAFCKAGELSRQPTELREEVDEEAGINKNIQGGTHGHSYHAFCCVSKQCHVGRHECPAWTCFCRVLFLGWRPHRSPRPRPSMHSMLRYCARGAGRKRREMSLEGHAIVAPPRCARRGSLSTPTVPASMAHGSEETWDRCSGGGGIEQVGELICLRQPVFFGTLASAMRLLLQRCRSG